MAYTLKQVKGDDDDDNISVCLLRNRHISRAWKMVHEISETTQIPNLAIFAPIFLKFSLKVQFFVLYQPSSKQFGSQKAKIRLKIHFFCVKIMADKFPNDKKR